MKNYYTEKYQKAFQTLNDTQKEAVEKYEGPLMVVAGPGTGKTQLLAIRIGYILKNTDCNPENILALTYTDAGSIAMRQRLLEFIGPEAYKVNIFTFHAFCNKVISENIEYFGGYRDLQKASELEIIEFLKKMIDNFPPEHPLRKLSGDIYFETHRMRKFFDAMKNEKWDQKLIESSYHQHIKEFKENPENQYKTKYKEYQVGDVKQSLLKKEISRFENTLVAAKEFSNYVNLMLQNNRFDYNDMILWVVDAFQSHPDLLLDYQERFQYILVDEYQDTNGAQNELLFLLNSYWEKPNVFVVGDDDQSIYRFQGANMKNLVQFQEKYQADVIVMQDNYRSTQIILDYAKKLIENNTERLVEKLKLQKNLVCSSINPPQEIKPTIIRYQNSVHEEKGIADMIMQWHSEGQDLSKVAVLYNKHSNAENLIKYLQANNIPINLKKETNIFDSILFKQIFEILQYLYVESKNAHSKENELFKILHFNIFEIPAIELGILSQYCSPMAGDKKERKWRTVISDPEALKSLELKSTKKILELSQKVEFLLKEIYNTTPQGFLEIMINKLGILQHIINRPNSTWEIQIMNSIFNLFKDECQKNPNYSLKDIIYIIQSMIQARIPQRLQKIIMVDNGVHFTTFHSSKGLEFDKVILMKNHSKNWSIPPNKDYKIPSTLIDSNPQNAEQEKRRLFYVGMTRAKQELYITYSAALEDGTPSEPCIFITELEQDLEQHSYCKLSDQKIEEYKFDLMKYQKGKIKLFDTSLLNKSLQNFSLSVTGLNKYLNCPLTFYFENILRVPGSRNKYNGFGNAIHRALEEYFRQLKKKPNALPPKSILLEAYKNAMVIYKSHFTDQEYKNYLIYGKECLTRYFAENSSRWLGANNYETEFSINDVNHKSYPINGNLDRIMEFPHGIIVTDYKTGNWKPEKMRPPDSKNEKGGDYWRQIVFYSLLIDAYPYKNWSLIQGIVSFIEPGKSDKMHEKTYSISPEEKKIVSEQIQECFEGIMSHNFEGCQKEECRWCQFVSQNGKM